MGMSASQARLIALTARMNDIEYQGQQINQQRTTLSNQVNALYNQLLEMSVPTPPSTSDYTKVQYSGTADASKFTLGNVVPTGKNDIGDSTYTVQFNYKRSGNSVSKSSTQAQVKSTPAKIGVKAATDITKNYLKTTTTNKPGNAIETTTGVDKDTQVLIKVTDATKLANLNYGNHNVYNADGTELTGAPASGGVAYVSCKLSNLTNDDYKNLVESSDDKYTNIYQNATVTNFDDSLDTEQDISSKGLYITNDTDKTLKAITTVGELKKAMEDGSNIVVLDATANGDYENPNYTKGTTGMSVGTMPVYKMSDAEAKTKLGSSYDEYLTSLRNAFPEEFDSDTDLDNVASKFYVYIEYSNGSIKPHFIKQDEISQLDKDEKIVSPYDYVADGTYTQTDTKKECQLEFDATSGRITKVGIPDGKGQVSWIDVQAETVTDQNAYEDAFNDYEYEKNVYDKKQQEINAKTSIVQQQDKNLELKLTRLDNERNAVNTEIEAVKKVVSDNIEKSYKTFSG